MYVRIEKKSLISPFFLLILTFHCFELVMVIYFFSYDDTDIPYGIWIWIREMKCGSDQNQERMGLISYLGGKGISTFCMLQYLWVDIQTSYFLVSSSKLTEDDYAKYLNKNVTLFRMVNSFYHFKEPPLFHRNFWTFLQITTSFVVILKAQHSNDQKRIKFYTRR
jgi:hypothetical protein